MQLPIKTTLTLALLGNLVAGQVCPRSLSIRSTEDHLSTFLDLLNLSDRPNPMSGTSIEARQRGRICDSSDSYAFAQCEINELAARGCNVLACISAATACVAACAAAGGQGGIDPVADLACLAAIGTFTAECAECDPRTLPGGRG